MIGTWGKWGGGGDRVYGAGTAQCKCVLVARGVAMVGSVVSMSHCDPVSSLGCVL